MPGFLTLGDTLRWHCMYVTSFRTAAGTSLSLALLPLPPRPAPGEKAAEVDELRRAWATAAQQRDAEAERALRERDEQWATRVREKEAHIRSIQELHQQVRERHCLHCCC